MGEITKAKQGQIEAPAKLSFNDLIRSKQDVFQSVMPKGFTAERLIQMAISARNTTPKLSQCDAASILSCCLRAASLGLEPSAVDGLGRAYILPYYNKKAHSLQAQFTLGKNGMLELVQRSGRVESIRTQCVYEGDDFDWYEDETGLHYHYRPNLNAPHGENNFRLVYLSARLKDGGSVFCAMSKAEVDATRSRSKTPEAGPWVTDYEAMAEKSVIRRAFNRGMLPRSVETVEAARAIAQDETTPVILDEEGYQVFGEMGDAVDVDPETGELRE